MKQRLFNSRARTAFTAAGVAVVGLGAAVSGVWLTLSAPVVAAAEPTISVTRAAALIDATTGSASEDVRAMGEKAKEINAALPFDSAPVAAASPFYLTGDALDRSRAMLCLTQAIYYEAGFEPMDGRRAVAQVVLNRLKHPAFPKSICGVVYQGSGTGTCQFTFVCDGSLYRAPEQQAWQQARLIAQAALAGFVERPVGEATHYHADYVAPRWAPLLSKVTQIGAHIFYRWPGAWGRPQAFTGRYIGEPTDPFALRPPKPALAYAAVATAPVESGPPIPRAPNDVGGLLDTSKGWTLNIPDPIDTRSASSRILASQSTSAGPVAVASAASVATAAR